MMRWPPGAPGPGPVAPQIPLAPGWWARPSAEAAGRPADTRVLSEARPAGGRVPFWALMSFTFILLLAPQLHIRALAPYRIALIAGALTIASLFLDRFLHRRRLVTPSPELWLVAGLVVWALFTIPLSVWPGGSLSFLIGLYLKALVIFWLLAEVVRTLPRLRAVAWGLSLMAIPLMLTAIQNYRAGRVVREGAERIVGYEAPLTANPNDLALMLNLILPLTIALLLTQRGPVRRAVLAGIVLLNVTAIIATFSRAGFLTLLTVLLVYAWKLRRRPVRGWVIAAILLAVLALPLLPGNYLTRLTTITDIEADPTGSAQARRDLAVAAVTFVLQNPIVGGGVGMDHLALREVRGEGWQHVHNVYLQYGVDLGLPGLVLFLTLLIRCIASAARVHRAGLRDSRGSGPWELSHLAEGIQVGLIAFAVAAPFYPVAYHFYFYYLAGLVLASRSALGAAEVPRPAPARIAPTGAMWPRATT